MKKIIISIFLIAKISVVYCDDATSLRSIIWNDLHGFGTIIIDHKYIINDTLTIPENIILDFRMGGMFDLNSGDTLFLNGYLKAGLFQIFSGSGKISFGSTSSNIIPQWFGVVSNDAFDDTDGFRKAIASMNRYSSLKVPKGKYYLKSEILIKKDDLCIDFNNSTINLFESNASSLFNMDGSNYVSISNAIFDYQNLFSYRAFIIQNCKNIVIRNVFFKNLRFDEQIYPRSDNLNLTSALTITNSENISIHNCHFTNWGYDDISGLKSEKLTRCIDIHGTDNRYISISNNFFKKVQIATLLQNAYNSQFFNNKIDTIFDNSIYFIGGDNFIVDNNIFCQGEEGVALTGSNLIISNNIFKNMSNKCIRIDSVVNCRITNNLFENINTTSAAIKSKTNISGNYPASDLVEIKNNCILGTIGWASIELYNVNKIIAMSNFFMVENKSNSSTGGKLIFVDKNTRQAIFSNNTVRKNYNQSRCIDLGLAERGYINCNIGDINEDEISYPANKNTAINKFYVNHLNVSGTSIHEKDIIITGGTNGIKFVQGLNNPTASITGYLENDSTQQGISFNVPTMDGAMIIDNLADISINGLFVLSPRELPTSGKEGQLCFSNEGNLYIYTQAGWKKVITE